MTETLGEARGGSEAHPPWHWGWGQPKLYSRCFLKKTRTKIDLRFHNFIIVFGLTFLLIHVLSSLRLFSPRGQPESCKHPASLTWLLRLQAPTTILDSFWLLKSYEDYKYLSHQATHKTGCSMQVSFIFKMTFIGGRWWQVHRCHDSSLPPSRGSKSWTQSKHLYPLGHPGVCKFKEHSVGSNFKAF